MDTSEKLFEQAQKVMPGGVNSPVRAYRAVGMTPRFIQSAKGAYITDVDGVQYIDYVGSWGPMILGHANSRCCSAVEQTMQNGLSFGCADRARDGFGESGRVPWCRISRWFAWSTPARRRS